MHKTIVALSAFAAVLMAVSAASRTEAAPLGNPGAMSGAVDDVGVVDSVHCRPGWRHHEPTRWRRANGCARGNGGVVIRERWIWRNGVRVRVGGGGDHRRGGTRTRTDVRIREGRGDRGMSGGSNRGSGGGMAGGGDRGMAGNGGGGMGGGGMGDGGGGAKQ